MNSELMTFSCSACGITLTVPRSMAGISGPCPSCAGVITAPTVDAASAFAPPAMPPPLPPTCQPPPYLQPEHDPLGSRLQPAARAMRPPTDGPPKGSMFSRMGVWIFLLLLASPFLLFGGMLVDLNGMFKDKQVENESSEETALINMIDQIVHPGDPKWQQHAGAQNLESAILTEGHRLQLEEEPEAEEEPQPEEMTTEEAP